MDINLGLIQRNLNCLIDFAISRNLHILSLICMLCMLMEIRLSIITQLENLMAMIFSIAKVNMNRSFITSTLM